jgi:hypothetical protein
MLRAAFLLTVGVTALLGACVSPSGVSASPQAYRLHVEVYLPTGNRVLNLDSPWEADKDGSPLNFTADAFDGVTIDRLRRAWTTLQGMREGQSVSFETDQESIRAWREAGFLVLEPHPHDRADENKSLVKIPDYITNTIIDNDGRLTDRDIARLAGSRSKVILVKVMSGKGDMSVWVSRAAADADD